MWLSVITNYLIFIHLASLLLIRRNKLHKSPSHYLYRTHTVCVIDQFLIYTSSYPHSLSRLLLIQTPPYPDSFLSTLLLIHNPSYPHSSLSTLLLIHTPPYPHSAFSILLLIHIPPYPHSFLSPLLLLHTPPYPWITTPMHFPPRHTSTPLETQFSPPPPPPAPALPLFLIPFFLSLSHIPFSFLQKANIFEIMEVSAKVCISCKKIENF